jgi:FkbM family methyltransferase
MTKVFFQIGTNNGYDLFRQIVTKQRPDLIILVEPNASLVDSIKESYSGVENVFIYNNAVFYRDDEEVELYIPAKGGIMGTRADNGIKYGNAHFSLIPMNDWGKKHDMVTIKTKSITFDKICNNHGITEIDYLQIDTEGFDGEILKMIDLTKYKIRTIRFEKWSFDPSKYTEHNKSKAGELGTASINAALQKLAENGYFVNDINDEDGNDFVATLVKF